MMQDMNIHIMWHNWTKTQTYVQLTMVFGVWHWHAKHNIHYTLDIHNAEKSRRPKSIDRFNFIYVFLFLYTFIKQMEKEWDEGSEKEIVQRYLLKKGSRKKERKKES